MGDRASSARRIGSLPVPGTIMKKKSKKQKDWDDKRHFVVHVDVYNVDIIFFIDKNENEIKKTLKKLSGIRYKNFNENHLDNWDKDIKNLGRMCSFMGGFVVMMKPKECKGFRMFTSTLVHELSHVTHYLLRDRGMELSNETEEAYTYLIEFLTREVLMKLY